MASGNTPDRTLTSLTGQNPRRRARATTMHIRSETNCDDLTDRLLERSQIAEVVWVLMELQGPHTANK